MINKISHLDEGEGCVDTAVYLFPYEKITHGSKVVIYGAGKVGQCYLQQIEKTGYCHVVCVADQRFQYCADHKMVVCSPLDILKFSFDKIVIAIDNVVAAQKVCNYLVNVVQIDKEIIVCGAGRQFLPDYVHNSLRDVYVEEKSTFAYGQGVLSMAFFVGDGLGDCIIAKRFIEEITRLAQTKYMIDIYGSKEYVNAVFSDNPCVYYIGASSDYFKQCQYYDLAIYTIYIISIDSLNHQKLIQENSRLNKVCSELHHIFNVYSLNAGVGIHMGIHFARCEKFGFNAYSAYNLGGVLKIRDAYVSIPLDKAWQSAFQQLGFKKYITINYGWGINTHGNQIIPAKIWPFAYYNELVRLLKKAYPALEIVQLGMKTTPEIQGVDFYVFGQSIELSKYILKNSMLHIDSEGGLVHLATQLGTKCVVFFGPTPVHYFGYATNINIVSKVCKNCCYLEDDFTKCIRGMQQPECMYSISPLIAFRYIQKHLDSIF